MTDELRGQRASDDGVGSEVAARPRRRYVRPELTEFGTVKELTRGASGNTTDTAGKRRRVL